MLLRWRTRQDGSVCFLNGIGISCNQGFPGSPPSPPIRWFLVWWSRMQEIYHSTKRWPVVDFFFNISFIYTTPKVFSFQMQQCKKLIFHLFSIRTESNWHNFFLILWPRLTSWYSYVWSKKWPQCNQQERTTLSRYGKNKDI